MLCYFLRHGAAEDAQTWQGTDFERPLTGAGKKRIAREAKAMAELQLRLDIVVTSPLIRARQTAEIVVKELDLRNALVEDERIGPGFSPERLARVLDEHRDIDGIMVVGHEPSMSHTIGTLIGGAEIDFKKGGLACIEIAESLPLRGTLTFLATPRLLVKKL
jgi:phosphohistidine phosphatase